jgi:hypothetical protein
VLCASTQALIADASKRMKRPTRTNGIRRSATNRRTWRSLVDSKSATADMSSSGAAIVPLTALSTEESRRSRCWGSKGGLHCASTRNTGSPQMSGAGSQQLFVAAAASTCLEVGETRCLITNPTSSGGGPRRIGLVQPLRYIGGSRHAAGSGGLISPGSRVVQVTGHRLPDGSRVLVRTDRGDEPGVVVGSTNVATGEQRQYTVRFADSTLSTWGEKRISTLG